MHRRSFLLGLSSLIAAPAVVQAASLMPVRGIIMPVGPLTVYVDGNRPESSTNNGLSPQTAFRTLDEALKCVDAFMSDMPGAAATIQMADGDYSMSRPFRAMNGQVLAVHGRGPTTRVVSAASPHGAIAGECSLIELRDFDLAWHSRRNVILTTGSSFEARYRSIVDPQAIHFAWPSERV